MDAGVDEAWRGCLLATRPGTERHNLASEQEPIHSILFPDGCKGLSTGYSVCSTAGRQRLWMRAWTAGLEQPLPVFIFGAMSYPHSLVLVLVLVLVCVCVCLALGCSRFGSCNSGSCSSLCPSYSPSPVPPRRCSYFACEELCALPLSPLPLPPSFLLCFSYSHRGNPFASSLFLLHNHLYPELPKRTRGKQPGLATHGKHHFITMPPRTRKNANDRQRKVKVVTEQHVM